MKCITRTMVVWVMVVAVCLASSALAIAEAVDLSSMSMEEILALQSAIGEELHNRNRSVVLVAGDYLVGKNIAAGSYTITPYNGDLERQTWSWGISIYIDSASKSAYEKAQQDYQKADFKARQAEKDIEEAAEAAVKSAALRAKQKAAGQAVEDVPLETPEKVARPEAIDDSKYRVFGKSFRANDSIRIELEEGQLLNVMYFTTLDLVISKNEKGLFMD